MRSDLELLAAWRGGDTSAGDELIHRYFKAVSRFFLNKVGDAHDDLVQRTFVACIEARERFEAKASFRTFLYAIARNVLLEYLRGLEKQRGRHFDAHLSSLSAIDPSPTQLLAQRESERLVLDALRRVACDHQVTLELYYWEGLSVTELSRVLDVPEGTVKGRLYRARRALASELAALQSAKAQEIERDDAELERRIEAAAPKL